MAKSYVFKPLTSPLATTRNRDEIAIDNKAAGGKTKRKMTEVLWMNY